MGSGTKWNLVVPVSVTILLAVTAMAHGRNETDCSPREHLPCTIIKPGCVPDANPPPEEGWPGKPRDLNATVYMKKHPNPRYQGKMYPGLNITWRIPDDASYKYIRGFQLTLTIMSGKYVGRKICRTFNLSQAEWNSNDLRDKVMFYYDGIYTALRKTTFFVQLYSLPKSAMGHDGNDARGYVLTPDSEDPNSPNPANWVTAMSYIPNTLDRRVDVWFMLAPPTYRFVHYDIWLINATSGTANQWTHKTQVVVSKGETGFKHVVFLEVCTGQYKVWVQPKNTGKYTTDCVCQDEHGTCAEFCVISSSAVFNFTSDIPCHVKRTTTTTTTTTTTASSDTPQNVPSTVTTSRTLSPVPPVVPETSSRHLSSTTPHQGSPVISKMVNTQDPDSDPMSGEKVASICVGVITGLLLLAIIAGLVYRRSGHSGLPVSCLRNKPSPAAATHSLANNDNFNTPAPAVEGVEICRKLRVLLVYANDHPLHLAVVHHLAQFLNSNCGCDVRFDQWSLDEIHRHSYINWLWHEIDFAERIIIVNSLGSYRQHEAHKQNAAYSNIADDSPPHEDGFLLAMQTIKNRFGKTLSCSYEKLIMVYFPYTSEQHVLHDINPGHRYKLMKHIEDVVFHLHGLQRFNPDSVQFIGGGINYEFYSHLTWGKELADSIDNMSAYVSSQPNWFDQRFMRSDSGFSSDGVDTENLELSDSQRVVSTAFIDVDEISVVAPVLDDWSSLDISENVAQINNEYDQMTDQCMSVNPSSSLDSCSIGGTSI